MKYSPYQEYFIHQIAAYTIQAGEILSKEVGQTDPKYSRLFLPKGPDLYTWPLKTAGYLLLDPQIDHIILIEKQSKYPNEVTVFEESEWVIALGKQLSIVPIIVSNSRKTKKADMDMLMQLNFLTMLKQISKITILGIWIDMDISKVAQEIKTASKSKKIWTIYYDTCSDHIKREKARSIDEQAMRQILKRKTSDILPVHCRLANIFVMTLPQRAQPELIGYVNTWDFGWDQNKTTSYASLIG